MTPDPAASVAAFLRAQAAMRPPCEAVIETRYSKRLRAWVPVLTAKDDDDGL